MPLPTIKAGATNTVAAGDLIFQNTVETQRVAFLPISGYIHAE
jgi:hypothetical protein